VITKRPCPRFLTTLPLPPPPGVTPFFSLDFDLIHMADTFINLLPITIIGEWVKGHYTGKQRKVQHDLNDEVDTLASGHCNNQPYGWSSLKLLTPPPGYKVRLLFQNSIITSCFYPTLAAACLEHELKNCILKETKWSSSTFATIDWTAHMTEFNKLT
jgi:hypothetical protein